MTTGNPELCEMCLQTSGKDRRQQGPDYEGLAVHVPVLEAILHLAPNGMHVPHQILNISGGPTTLSFLQFRHRPHRRP